VPPAWPGLRARGRTVLLAVVAVLVVLALVLVGLSLWQRFTRTGLEQAVDAVPASSLRLAYTDWSLVRSRLDTDVDTSSSATEIEEFIAEAYDTDFAAASSIDESAAALQDLYGFSPVTAEWEAFAQGRRGAAMVLRVPDADFDALADNLDSIGYEEPAEDDGVWKGGVDLVAATDPTLTPELQYVALLEDEGLVVTSDNAKYAATAARAAKGDADTLGSTGTTSSLAEAFEEPATAMLWAGDFACEDLAMSSADEDDQATAEQLVADAGGVSPLSGLAMAMSSDRTLQVVGAFEDERQAEDNLRPRAKLAVGEAVGRGGSFADDFELTASRAVDSTVRLTLEPRESTGFVLSALYDGPVLFATC
jgi:hypothetical protein